MKFEYVWTRPDSRKFFSYCFVRLENRIVVYKNFFYMSLRIYALGEMHIKAYKDSFRTSGICSEILKQYFKEWNK